jgi:hydroxypyruvate isomerase
MRLAVNVGFLFAELPYLERFLAVRAAGFEAVEFAWPDEPIEEVARAAKVAGLGVVLIGVAAGGRAAGDSGDANDPAARDRWRLQFEAAMRLADDLACPALSVLAGNRLAGVSMVIQLDTFRDNLAWALPRAAAAGRTLTLELLNPDDAPRYLLTDPARTRALLEAVGDPALRLQFDTYEFGRMVPDVAASFRELAPFVGHVHVGDVPDRHEPGTGAIEWAAFFGAIAASGYDGPIGLRYEPSAGTFEGLGWIEAYGLERSETPPRS